MGFTIRHCKVHNRWQFHMENGFLPCCLYLDVLRLRRDINGIMQARNFIVPSPIASRRDIAEQTLNMVYMIAQQSLNQVPVRVGKLPKPKETPKDEAPTQPVDPQPAPPPADEDVKSS